MSESISTRRKNRFNLFREANALGSFDEFPMLQPEIDPQVHLSRNDVDQPFYLLCEKDNVLAQFSGKSRVMFADGSVRYFDLSPGDYVYIPGGTPHRLLVTQPGNIMRYKARDAGKEAVVWYCENCSSELDRSVWDTASVLPQSGYQIACERFNSEPERRKCAACGHTHNLLDLSHFRWKAVAEAINAVEESV